MTALILWILADLSVYFEMISLMIAFREYLTWRMGLTWFGVLTVYLTAASIITNTWQNLPLVFTNVLPLVLINAYMLHKLLYIRGCITLPISILLNASKRFFGGIFGLAIQVLFQPNQPPIYMKTNLDWHLVYQFINLIGAELGGLPFIILMGVLGHYLVTKYAFTDFMQHAQLDGYDYLVVTLSVLIYTLVFYYDTQWSLGWQAITTAFFSVGFGGLDIYLVMNKNNQLSDTNLLRQINGYNDLLKVRNQELHTFRHDYQNILLSMEDYIQEGDLNGLKSYFDTVVEPTAKTHSLSNNPERLKLIDNSAVVGLLYAKYTETQKLGIDFNVSIADVVKIPTDNPPRLIRVLNTLLDNGIELAKNSDRQLGVLVEQLDQQVRFTITSQLPAKSKIDLDQIQHQRFRSFDNQFGSSLNSLKQLTTKKIQVSYELQEHLFISHATITTN